MSPHELTRKSTRNKGAAAEEQALRYLQQQGLALVTRNYQCKLGELDLIMRDDKHLVFVEVRARRNLRFGQAIETVTIHKQRRLMRAAAHYLQRYAIDMPCRFDVLGLHYDSDSIQFNWVKDAFQA